MAVNKFKGSKYTEGFTGIVHSVFECPAFPAFPALSPHTCKLLLAGQYRGNNNGDLTVAWSLVSKRGWVSRTTLWRCKAELINRVCVRDAQRSLSKNVRAAGVDLVRA